MLWDAAWPLLALTAFLWLLFWPFSFRLEVEWPPPPRERSIRVCWLLGPWCLRLFGGAPGSGGGAAGGWKAFPAAFRELSWLVQEVRDLQGRVEVGTADAAGSAILAGLVWGAWGTLLGLLQSRVPIRPAPQVVVTPRYGQGGVAVRLHCILRTRVVHLMGVAPTLKVLGGRRHGRSGTSHG